MLFRRRKKEESHREASNALKQANENLRQVQARTQEVHEVARALRILRVENHFQQKLEAIMIGGPK